jgi:hypothetical protein
MLTAAPTQTKRLISLLAALLVSTSAAAQTYEPALIPPQILGAPTTMTPLNLGDDGTRNVALGFEFEYWGQTFTDAWVSSNGFVSFQSGAHLCCNGQPIEMAQRNTIYAYWSDLISYTGNPYYRREDGSILFGWYGVNEYGTNNSSTFEIGLFADGKIQLNFGNLGFSGRRDFTAGITGPTADDNIPLFYGRNAQFLQNQSGLLSWIAPEPEVVPVDCNATPMDPTCPPASVAIDVGAPDPTESTLEAAVASVEQTAQEEVQMEDVAEQVMEEAQEALETAEASLEADAAVETEEPAAEEEAVEDDAIEELVAEQDLEDFDSDDERLSPDELAALAAQGPEDDRETLASETLASLELEGAESALEGQGSSDGALEQEGSNQIATALEESAQGMQSAFFEEAEQASQASAFESSSQSVQGFAGFQMRVDFGSSSSVAGGSGVGVGSSPIDAAISVGSPMSMANTFEILNSVGSQSSAAPVAASASSEKSDNEMSEGQSETIEEMGSVPAFNAYRQAVLSDRADFYAVRDIYRNRRLQDANFELYRLMQTNDARWQEMVDEQYR